MKKLFGDFVNRVKKSDLVQRIKDKQIEKEAYFLWEADGKPEGKDEYYWTLATDKIKTEKSFINKLRKVFNDPIFVKGGTMLAVLAAFCAFALTIRQKEFDRFSLVKPVFEVEQLEDKKFKLFNHNGLVFFIGCNQKYRDYGDNPKKNVLFNKLKTTPKRYSSLSKTTSFKTTSLEFIFKKEIKINKDDYFICYYRDVDENLYELKIVYGKNLDTNTNYKSFYIEQSPFTYRSELFVTMSRKWLLLDKIVSFIFPKDWYEEHKDLKKWFNECEAYSQEYQLGKIDKCLTVKYSNSDG